jgi:hypothetical protein
MKQSKRIVIAVLILSGILAIILGVDWQLRRAASLQVSTATPLPPGSVPIYLNGTLVGGFAPSDLEKLQKVTFTDTIENKPQDGWLLRDVVLLYIPAQRLQPETQVVVSSSSRDKKADLTWMEIQNQDNMVMFDLSNRGTLKLVSAALPKLDTREEWVQDADRIEITAP